MVFQKGEYKHSEETKRKMSELAKGRIVSDETRKKISEGLKGIKRKPLSEEHRRKIGFGNKGKIISKESRKRMSESHKGKIRSNESKKKMSMTRKQLFIDGYISPLLGRHRSEETKRKISLSKIGHIVTEKTKMKMVDTRRKNSSYEWTDEMRRKLSLSTKGKKRYPLTEEHKKKISATEQGIKLEDWKGFIQFEPYDERFNNKFKRVIRKRDNQICMLCGIHREKLNKSLTIHHINYDKRLSIPENCISLCISCHIKTNYNRQHWIKFFQSLLAERYDYKYEDKQIILKIRE